MLSAETSNTPGVRSHTASWFVMSAIAVAMISLAVVHAPQRVKLPLLLPLALAALLGWGLGRLAVLRQVGPWRFVVVAVGLLAGMGTVLTACETYRRGVAHVRREIVRQSLENDPLAAELERHFEQQSGEIARESDSDRRELLESIEKARQMRAAEVERQQRLATFVGYLANRIPKSWGRWPAWLAIAFWLTEVLGSMVVAAWAAALVVPASAGIRVTEQAGGRTTG